LKYMLAGTELQPTTTLTTVRAAVLGGLNGIAAGSDVIVSSGVLVQNSTTLPPVPGPLDSSYRFARNPEPATLPVNIPTGCTLVEAQMVKIISLSETRGIYDPGSQTFVPTLVEKQYEYVVQFQQTSDPSTVPAPSGADWVPLFAYSSASGSVTNIYDLRPLAGMARPDDSSPGEWMVNDSRGNVSGELPAGPGAFGAVSYNYNCRVMSKFGELYLLQRNPQVPVQIPYSSTFYRATGYTPAPGQWQYQYLSTWFGLTPRTPSALESQGVFVWSDQGPVARGSRFAPVGIQLPGIWGNYSTSGGDGDAVLVYMQGVLANSGTGGQMTSDGHLAYVAYFPSAISSTGVTVADMLSPYGGTLPNGACAVDTVFEPQTGSLTQFTWQSLPTSPPYGSSWISIPLGLTTETGDYRHNQSLPVMDFSESNLELDWGANNGRGAITGFWF